MCGIFAYLGSGAGDKVIEGLKKLEYRGYDSWGVGLVVDRESVVEKRVGRIGEVNWKSVESQMALGHTRWATHGRVSEEAAHPHLDCTRRYMVVHNGIVENFLELKRGLVETGHEFASETDSEVIAHWLEEARGGFGEKLAGLSKVLEGLSALVVIDAVDQKLGVVALGAPIILGQSSQGLAVASDVSAMGGEVSGVRYLALGEVALMEDDEWRVWSKGWRRVEYEKTENVEQSVELSEGEDFMSREMLEQIQILPRKLGEYQDQVKKMVGDLGLDKGRKLALVGSGSAYLACRYGEYLLARGGVEARSFAGAEFESFRELYGENDRVVFVSQSGETMDVLVQARWCMAQGMKIGAVVNRENSSLERLVGSGVLLGVGVEICVLATKSMSAMAVVMMVLSEVMAKKEMDLAQNLVKSVGILERFGKKKVIDEEVLKRLAGAKQVFVLGKAEYVPLASEGALKLKEVTYIPTEGMAGSELKHGSLAVVDEEVCVVVVSDDEEIVKSASEVAARGGFVIGVGEHTSEIFDYMLATEGGWLGGLFGLQVLAWELAKYMGRDVDKPRNLAKSVTVL